MTKIPSNPEPPQQASLRHPGGGASGNDSRALHQEYTWIHGVIENLPFDVFAIDAEGRYAMQNKACRDSHRSFPWRKRGKEDGLQ